MANKTYLYSPSTVTAAQLIPIMPAASAPTVGDSLSPSQVPITVDESYKADLDDAMADLGYFFVSEYTGGAPIVGRTDHGVITADPTGITPADGDIYYNSSLQMEMRYDASRSKWLSIEAQEFSFGRDGVTAFGQFFRTADGRVMSDALGWYAIRSGTIVSFGYARSDTAAVVFDFRAGGVSIATVASAAVGGRDISMNADFTFGQILATANQIGAGAPSDVVGWMRVKWRV